MPQSKAYKRLSKEEQIRKAKEDAMRRENEANPDSKNTTVYVDERTQEEIIAGSHDAKRGAQQKGYSAPTASVKENIGIPSDMATDSYDAQTNYNALMEKVYGAQWQNVKDERGNDVSSVREEDATELGDAMGNIIKDSGIEVKPQQGGFTTYWGDDEPGQEEDDGARVPGLSSW